MSAMITLIQVELIPGYVVFLNRECFDRAWDSHSTYKHLDHYTFLTRPYERQLWKGELEDVEQVTLLYGRKE